MMGAPRLTTSPPGTPTPAAPRATRPRARARAPPRGTGVPRSRTHRTHRRNDTLRAEQRLTHIVGAAPTARPRDHHHDTRQRRAARPGDQDVGAPPAASATERPE